MLCDAVQGFGRMAMPDGPDLVAVSAHKIHGPKGVGGLWMRKGAEPAPLLHGGGQEQGLRSGTLSPALCVGFGDGGAAGDRAARRATTTHVEQLCAGRAGSARRRTGRSTAASSSAIAAISTSAATGSTARG